MSGLPAMAIVLDSSALLAAIRNEPGADRVEHVSQEAIASAISLAESAANLVRRGVTPDAAMKEVSRLVERIIAFDESQALESARLVRFTHHLGLSLADRACLALGKLLRAKVLTTDRKWAKLEIGVEIELIR